MLPHFADHFFNKPIKYYNAYYSFYNKSEYYKRYLETDYQVLSNLRAKKYTHINLLQNPICVKNLHFGDNQLEVMLKWGFPICKFSEKMGSSKHRILLYKSDFGKLRCYTSCHFVKGRLAFIQSCFPHLDQVTRTNVLSVLMQKYQFNAPADVEELLLHNNAGERIVIQSDIYLNLFYFSEDFLFAYCIKQFLETEENSKVRLRNEQYRRLKELL